MIQQHFSNLKKTKYGLIVDAFPGISISLQQKLLKHMEIMSMDKHTD